MVISNSICKLVFIGLCGLFLFSCGPSKKVKVHEFPIPVETTSQPIHEQERKTYQIDNVYASNEFDGARLNDFEKVNDSTFRATIKPENEPINESAYFCMELWSDKEQKINLELYYPNHEHRYVPKLSHDKKSWTTMDTMDFDTLNGPDLATLKLRVGPNHKFVCGQELMTSSYNNSWCRDLSKSNSSVRHSIIGQSTLGRDISFLDIYNNSPKDKKAIVIFSRLHPPEVPGYIAMQEFVNTILDTTSLSKLFREKFRILVYPMVNPDGVDMGHWRHNAGGIDLNRDWSHYRQQEPWVVASHCVKTIAENKNKVLVGLDFHSTQEDVLYTLTDNRKSSVFGFKDIWVDGIKDGLEGHDPNDDPYDLNTPITKGWFFLQFGAEGITYEVGDETDRSFIKQKAQVAAKEMMKLLVLTN